MMKIEEIKTIVELMSEHDLTEFKIESADMTLCLKRGSQQPVPVMAPAVIPAASPMVTAAEPLLLLLPLQLRLHQLLLRWMPLK